ncbi:MAG: winged helix-turn-helix domain-containing protein [Candidatus Nanohaloarchaea archaeon]|nr:winged helix-turn-helix domain-containing protein [Candidatus Nanohaloarchaea archaeon]
MSEKNSLEEKTGLANLMDDSIAEIVDFLLENPVLDYSKKDIAKGAGVSRSTLHRKWKILEQLNIVRPTRKYQKTQLYKLDENSELVNDLGRLKRDLEETGIIARKKSDTAKVHL